MSAAFSSAMTAALDRYDTPQLPDGFADRLVARASAEAALQPATKARRSSASPWKRASRIVGSVAAIGFFSATAAAMGIFGEPVEIPVFSDVARELALVDQPRPVARAIAATPSPKAAPTANAALASDEQPVGETDDAARVALERMASDPRFDNLTPRQKRRMVGRTARKLVRSGDATRAEVRSTIGTMVRERRATAAKKPRRAALRERIKNASPEQKTKLRERFEALPAERQAKIKARLGAAPASTQDAEADNIVEPAAAPNSAPENTVAPAPVTPPAPAVKPSRAERAARLRDRYRSATPAQRAAARERAKQRREATRRKPSVRERRTKIRRRRN